MSRPSLDQLPSLLEESPMLGGSWDPSSRQLELRFDGERRRADGSPMPEAERQITLRATGVRAVVATHEPPPDVKPSAFVVSPQHRVSLVPWTISNPAFSPLVDVGTGHLPPTYADSLVKNPLAGAGLFDSERATWLALDQSTPDALDRLLWVIADSLQMEDGLGAELTVDRVSAEVTAYGAGLRGGLVEHDDPRSAATLLLNPEPEFRADPPDAPFVEVAPTNTPTDLLEALERFLVPGDGPGAASGGFADCGEWFYAREVAQWWVEGDRAFLRVKGIRHIGPFDDDEEGENLLEVNDVALRRREPAWEVSWLGPPPPTHEPAWDRRAPWIRAWRWGLNPTQS